MTHAPSWKLLEVFSALCLSWQPKISAVTLNGCSRALKQAPDSMKGNPPPGWILVFDPKQRISGSLIWPDGSCCVEDGGDCCKNKRLAEDILKIRQQPIHQSEPSCSTRRLVSPQSKKEFSLCRFFLITRSVIYGRVAAPIRQPQHQALPPQRGRGTLSRGARGRLYRAGPKALQSVSFSQRAPPGAALALCSV